MVLKILGNKQCCRQESPSSFWIHSSRARFTEPCSFSLGKFLWNICHADSLRAIYGFVIPLYAHGLIWINKEIIMAKRLEFLDLNKICIILELHF